MGYGRNFKTAKEISGFNNGVIYIVKGNSFDVKDALREAGARFRRDFGWYFGSFCEKPDTLPAGLELVELTWDEVGNEDGSFKNDEVIKAAIEAKIYDADPSEFVGSIGERLEVEVTVESKREFEGSYGTQLVYRFRDENNNCFSWFTSAGTKTSFEEGETCIIRGTLKSHDVYRNCKLNTLSRVSRR